MEYFEPIATRTYRAVRLGRIIPERTLAPLVTGSALATALSAGFWLAHASGTFGSWHATVLLFALTDALFAYTLFFKTYLSAPPTPHESANIADRLDYSAMRIATSFTSGDLSALLLPMRREPGMEFVLVRLGILPASFFRALTQYLQTDASRGTRAELAPFLRTCASTSDPSAPVSWREILLGLASRSPFLQQTLSDAHVEPADLKRLLAWQRAEEARRTAARRFWSRENLLRARGIGRDWAAGYAASLDRFATEVTDLPQYADSSLRPYGRTAEAEQTERVLARDGKNNVILVGPPGVGKTMIIASLARRIERGETLAPLAYKHIRRLDTGALLSGNNATQDSETRLRLVLADAMRAGNSILLIDDIHTLFDESGAAGTINAREVLLPYLTSARLQVIGMTTDEGYHQTVAAHADLAGAFEKVEVREPEKEAVYAVLREIVPRIEAHDRALILFQALRAAIELSDRYLKNAPFPEKAIDLLQEAAVYAHTRGRGTIVTAADVEAVLARKTGIPVGDTAASERTVLLSLEQELHKRVIGQDEAISVIANAMRRARAGVTSAKKPIGSFLFLGPTGVGKTETAKALAAAYFGAEKHMVRFDMSEYQEQSSLSRLIGHESEGGLLTTALLDHPFSLVLLDEIEKAHPDILNVFLQVLDDGRLTDALGRTVDFTNAIIIATSNAGAEMIREAASASHDADLKARVLESLQTQGVFRPEFLNRFDAIVMFDPLTETQERQIAALMLADLNRRLAEKGVSVAADDAALAKLVALGFSTEFGARPLRRVIQDRVENVIAKKLLAGELSRGSTFTLRAEDLDVSPTDKTDSSGTYTH
ncbi:MAG TPA: AAA family ATPase [Candidatus Paceibacterota bacterium]